MGKNNSKDSSTDILAQAMRRVFKESIEEGVAPLGEHIDHLGKRTNEVEKSLSDRIDTTNKKLLGKD